MKDIKVSEGKMGSLDFISELPEFILHLILSLLSTEESCRASILSRKWYNAWSSIPVLDFQPDDYFKKARHRLNYGQEFYDENRVQRYVVFIDRTMQRYSIHKYFIKKFKLEFPRSDDVLEPLIDKWLGIAVQCRIEELDLVIYVNKPLAYRLPETLFSAKSMKTLLCRNLVIPYYETIKLDSLISLNLINSTIDEPMLQKILASCPLIDLSFHLCSGFKKVWIPWMNKSIKNLDHTSIHCDVNGSTLQDFTYYGLTGNGWPFKINVGVLRNLRKLDISYAAVTDDILFVLVSQLKSLESLVILSCSMLKNIEVSSEVLKKFQLMECDELKTVKINAPNLVIFWYDGAPRPSLTLRNYQVHCDTHFYYKVDSHPRMGMFINLKEFLVHSNIFKVMELDLSYCDSEVDVGEDIVKEIANGSSYKLEEVKLSQTCAWEATRSSVPAFLDCLFWCCCPDLLTMVTTSFENPNAKFLLEALKDKVKCWKHPLKRIEVQGVDSSTLISFGTMEIKLRLYW